MQAFGLKLLVDLDSLIESKLTLDGWFLLFCLANNKQSELITYVENCSKLNKSIVLELENRGFLRLKIKDNYSLNSIMITDNGKILVSGSITHEKEFDELFKQLRDTYPKRVPGENGSTRPLHGDLARCKKLYKRILTEYSKDGKLNLDLHKKILSAITKEVVERTKGRRLPFMQNLATYLHQHNYSQYIDVEVTSELTRGDDI